MFSNDVEWHSCKFDLKKFLKIIKCINMYLTIILQFQDDNFLVYGWGEAHVLNFIIVSTLMKF